MTRDDEIALARDSSRWPGETLCLKRRPRPGETAGVMGYAAFGVITTGRAPLVVYLCGRVDFKTTAEYDTIEAMFNDGWEID